MPDPHARSLPMTESLSPFVARHIGPRDGDHAAMLDVVGVPSLDALVDTAGWTPDAYEAWMATLLERTLPSA